MTQRGLIVGVVCWVVWAVTASAQVSVVASNKATQDNASPATLAVQLTGIQAGDAIVVCGVVEGTQTISFSDDKANSYNLVADVLNANNRPRTRVMYAGNVASGDTTITMTLSAANYRAVFAAALRNVPTSMLTDGSNSNSGTASTATAGSITPTQNGIIVGCLGTVGPSAITPASGWTELQEEQSSCCSSGSLIYRLTTASAFNAEWDNTDDPRDWVAIAIAIKSAGTVGGGGGRMLMGVGE